MDFPRLATQYKLMQINGHFLALVQLFAWFLWKVLGYQVVPRKEGIIYLWSLLCHDDSWALEICDGEVGKCSIFQVENLKKSSTTVTGSWRIFLQSFKRVHKSRTTDPLLLYPGRIMWSLLHHSSLHLYFCYSKKKKLSE